MAYAAKIGKEGKGGGGNYNVTITFTYKGNGYTGSSSSPSSGGTSASGTGTMVIQIRNGAYSTHTFSDGTKYSSTKACAGSNMRVIASATLDSVTIAAV